MLDRFAAKGNAVNNIVGTTVASANDSMNRLDTEQADRIEEALSLQGRLGLNAAIQYMEHHAVSTDTLLRVLMLPRQRRQVALADRGKAFARIRRFQQSDAALDEALAASFPASDPVAITIS
jgi:hypothetical protein